MKLLKSLGPVAVLLAAFPQTLTAYDGASDTPAASGTRQYTFAWQFLEGDDMAPRGGTTKGPGIELVKTPGDCCRNPALASLSAIAAPSWLWRAPTVPVSTLSKP